MTAQRRDPDSLLNWFERLIRRRRESPELGFGTLQLLDPRAPSVFAHRCDWEDSTVICVHELSGKKATAVIDIDEPADAVALVDLFAANDYEIKGNRVELALEGYARRWFRVRREGRRLPP